MKHFLALVSANLEKSFKISDESVKLDIGPVYENGFDFCNEILIKGSIVDDVDEDTLSVILKDYIREHTAIVKVRKIEFRTVETSDNKSYNEFKRAS